MGEAFRCVLNQIEFVVSSDSMHEAQNSGKIFISASNSKHGSFFLRVREGRSVGGPVVA